MTNLHPVAVAYRDGRRGGESDYFARLRAVGVYRTAYPGASVAEAQKAVSSIIADATQSEGEAFWRGVPGTVRPS